jgi:predicted amino acid racemase
MINYSTFVNSSYPTPRLEIYPSRIKHNARKIIDLCKKENVQVACVTKVLCGHPSVAEVLVQAGAAMLADSRLENIAKLRRTGFKGPFMLLRLPAVSQADQVVELADISLNSSLKTMKALGKAAVHKGKIHRVIVMVDVGDLREGVWPDKVVALFEKATKIEGIELIGMGCNLACYGGVIPSEKNMKTLVDAVKACREATGLKIPILCGGNSSGLPLLAEKGLPDEINLYRIGEAIILGRNVIDRSPWPETRQDTVIAVAEVIEAETKPSVPIGERGQDAFGETQEFQDLGKRRRVICNIGRQDVAIDGIEPIDSKIKVLGGSSDHLILDVEDCEVKIEVGDEIAFYPGYGALLALSTSEYVEKVVIHDK